MAQHTLRLASPSAARSATRTRTWSAQERDSQPLFIAQPALQGRWTRMRVRCKPDSETAMYNREAAWYGRPFLDSDFTGYVTADPADATEFSISGIPAPAGPLRQPEVQSKPKPGLPPQAEPDVRLVTKMRVQDTNGQAFWNDFMFKCRLAWDVFFPSKPQVLTPAGAGKSRMRMILVSDRCGLDLPTLLQMKNSSMAALASENGWQEMAEVELQVASVKPSGERIQMTLPLTSMPDEDQLRDPEDYMFEIQPTEESDMHESSLLARNGMSSS